ncbi:uncharacterized protein LOC110977690 [Acanthaster planci]|uniref:Uncharacterized protein LOC110977690 n=1 Tax=Acanthaster planci TaxID=133434 RepID=A0A8B7Y590_ACAPL|nr:uncharacterized protein LOC110977690 [Acanthaster planci]XP_022087706.1 uncharacterized protein LOC110977690 [Acanthaster planci]XP_022087707.1 uncharacterized protein LOC110977690 [Acanthaster planci]
MKEYQDIIIPIDMSTLSVKAKHGSDPPPNMSPSVRHKVHAPSMEMTRAKAINNIEEQQLTKKLRDLEKQQSKMQSEILNLRAALLPEIKVTSAWEDNTPSGSSIVTNPDTDQQIHSDPPGLSSMDNKELPRERKRSGSLPPLAIRKEIEQQRQRTSSESAGTGTLFAPTPPSNTSGIRRARSMNEINGRPRPRPQSAHTSATTAGKQGRRGSIPRTQSLNSSTESLPSDPSKTISSPNKTSPAGSTEDITRPRAQTLLPLRKSKSTSNINNEVRTRRVTVDTADLTRLDKNSIFKNPSYNPVLLNPSQQRAANSVTHRRRATCPVRLSHLSPDGIMPSPPGKSTPSLQDQFEQLKACRYLRVPSEETD